MLFEHTCMFYVQIFIFLLDYISGQEEDNQPNVDPVREQTLALFFLCLVFFIFNMGNICYNRKCSSWF